MSADCQFCRIVSGSAEAHRIREDEYSLAFLDANPATTGHTLVVPKTHRTDLLPTTGPVAGAVFRTVRDVAVAIEGALDPDGFSLFHSSGLVAGTVEHAHVHLLPRYEDDDVALSLDRGRLSADEGERLAEQFRTVLEVETRGEH